MQIKEAIIGQFGKLQNRNISFEPGINVIYGENEAGKTTLHDFLLGMFFGMEKGRGRGTLNSMYQSMSLGMHLPITVVPCDFWWMENHFI